MIYIGMFVSSLIFLCFGMKTQKKAYSKILIFIGLLLPCILAGLRDVSVGSDTKAYVLGLFNLAKKSTSMIDFFKLSKAWYGISDYSYLIITYICSTYLKSINVLFFIFEFLMIFPLYFAVKRISKNNKYSMLTFIFIIYMFFYNSSLNMTRQSIAIAFILLSFSYVVENYKNRKNIFFIILFFLIGCEFHNTALISILVFILYFLYDSNKIKKTYKYFISILIIILSILFVIFFKNIIWFLGTTNIYSHAIRFAKVYTISFDFNTVTLLLNLFIVIFIIYNRKKIMQKNMNYLYGLTLSISTLILSIIGAFIKYADRITLYGTYILLIYYVSTIIENKKIDLNKIGIVTFFVFYWIYMIYIYNVNNTLPYIFLK